MKIYKLKGRFVNSYIVEEDDQLFVVDVALHGEAHLLGYIRETLRYDLARVALVVCTHDDQDHSGGLVAVARECNAPIGLPYASHSMIRKLWHNPWGVYYRPVTAIEEALRPRMWRMYLNPCRRGVRRRTPRLKSTYPSSFADRKVPPDFYLKHYDQLPGFDDWILVHTPGHSWDSCCFFHRSTRSLISGDTLLGSTKQRCLVLPGIYANPRQVAKTVARIKALAPLHVYPGHGSSFHGEGLLDHL